jgi:transposase
VQVARQLRVSTRSAYQWRRRWRAGGPAALASKGRGGTACRLTERQLARRRAALDLGPAAYGWREDQRWTLARITTLIGRLFHVRYTLRGTSYLLHRIGFSPQVPVHRAAERDEAAIAAWRAGTWAKVRRLAAATGAWICFEDEAGQALRPPKARTWARRGHTPVVTVSGKGSGRVSVAGLVCLRPGARGHLFYRMRIHRGRKGERRSLSEAGYADLITAGHNQLAGPVIVIWDNLNTHGSAVMREFTQAHPDWATVVQLPACAPDLNPVEGVWANMKNGLGNLAPSSADQLARVVRNRLKRIRYNPALIDGFLAQTGLTLGPGPP